MYDVGLDDVKESDILLYAAQLGYCTIIQLLCKWGMNANKQSSFTGTTPLLTVVSPNHLSEDEKKKTVAVLLKCNAKASVNVQNHVKDSPLTMAVLTKHADVFDQLLDAGAAGGEPDADGNTIMHIATQVNAVAICEKMMDKDEFKNMIAIQNNDGQTPIHLAAMHSPQCLSGIISALKNQHDQSGYLKFVEWFSAPDSGDCTPLDVAAKAGQKETFELMWTEVKKYSPAYIEAERSKLRFFIKEAESDPSQWQRVNDFLKLVPKRM